METRPQRYLGANGAKTYQRQETAKITAAAMSFGTLGQFSMDLALRHWMRRSAW